MEVRIAARHNKKGTPERGTKKKGVCQNDTKKCPGITPERVEVLFLWLRLWVWVRLWIGTLLVVRVPESTRAGAFAFRVALAVIWLRIYAFVTIPSATIVFALALRVREAVTNDCPA